MSSEQPSHCIEIKEYLLASALRAARVHLVECRLDSDSRVTFVFDDEGGKASGALRQHQMGELRLPSIDYIQAVLLTKQEMFATRRGGGLS